VGAGAGAGAALPRWAAHGASMAEREKWAHPLPRRRKLNAKAVDHPLALLLR
jgi:hypothetical protein